MCKSTAVYYAINFQSNQSLTLKTQSLNSTDIGNHFFLLLLDTHASFCSKLNGYFGPWSQHHKSNTVFIFDMNQFLITKPQVMISIAFLFVYNMHLTSLILIFLFLFNFCGCLELLKNLINPWAYSFLFNLYVVRELIVIS